MDNNNTFISPVGNVPAGYAAPEKPKNRGHKIFIIVMVAVLLFIAIIAIVLLVMSNTENKVIDTNSAPVSESKLEYDSGDEDTGGESADLAENQSLNFLRKYGLTDVDIESVNTHVIQALSKYYVSSSYDDVYYDVAGAKISDEKDKITFTFKTDKADKIFHVSIKLLKGELYTISII